jgi:hypothetical protein
MNTLSFDDFVCYAMIFAAHANLEIDQQEKAYIQSVLGAHRYDEMLQLFESESDEESIERILNLRHKYLRAEGGDELLFDAITRVFKSDGEFDQVEHQTLDVLKKVFAGAE